MSAKPNLLRNTSLISLNSNEQSGILLRFEDEVVHAKYKCFTASGNYSVNGATALQMQLHLLDTTCENDDQNLKQDGREFQSIIHLLNSISTFSYKSSDSELFFLRETIIHYASVFQMGHLLLKLFLGNSTHCIPDLNTIPISQ